MEHYTSSVKYLITSKETCMRYMELEEKIGQLVNKKRKEAEREIAKIKETNKYLNEDVKILRECCNVEDKYNMKKREIDALNTYINNQSALVRETLIKYGFIVCEEGGEGGGGDK